MLHRRVKDDTDLGGVLARSDNREMREKPLFLHR